MPRALEPGWARARWSIRVVSSLAPDHPLAGVLRSALATPACRRERRRLATPAMMRARMGWSLFVRSRSSNGSPQSGDRNTHYLRNQAWNTASLQGGESSRTCRFIQPFIRPPPGDTWLQYRAISGLHACNTALCAIAPEVESNKTRRPS